MMRMMMGRGGGRGGVYNDKFGVRLRMALMNILYNVIPFFDDRYGPGREVRDIVLKGRKVGQ